MKRILFPLFILLLFFFCILHPAESIRSASAGLSLWYYTVLPTLLPCMILSGYLISSELVRRLPPLPFALVTGWFCGYPMGAKTVADLYRAGRVAKEEGNRLLLLCCGPSPMFLTGYIGTGMLHLSPARLLPCLAAVYLPPVLCFGGSLLFSGKRMKRKEPEPVREERKGFLESFLSFEEAMMNGFLIIAKVGGYLMLFTMLAYFFQARISSPLFSALVPGLLEMTSGTAFAVLSGLPEKLTVALCFSFAAFGGMSGFFQTASVLGSVPLSKLRYLLGKGLQAAATFGLIWLLL